MFWSKVWFFLVAAAAAALLAAALIVASAGERHQQREERRRLITACSVTGILLTENADTRVDLAGQFSRFPVIADALARAEREETVSPRSNRMARDEATKILGTFAPRPDFVLMIDRRGRLVAQVGLGSSERGDLMAGYFLVDDALDGFLRDDLWLIGDTLVRVAASPVIQRAPGADRYVGAIVLGHEVDKEFARDLAKELNVDVGFYVGEGEVAGSAEVFLEKEVAAHFRAELLRSERPRSEDCGASSPFTLGTGQDTYAVLLARLPGEAAAFGAFYAVFFKRSQATGLAAALGQVRKEDLAPAHFPWVPVVLVFVGAVGLGLLLMAWEVDRPLRRLARDAVRLAKEEGERLDEMAHRGKYGSIARSVNIRLDKIQREAKAAQTNLDQLLGPAPGSSRQDLDTVGLGIGFDAGASALPPVGPGGPPGPAPPPPPADFRFSDAGARQPLGGASLGSGGEKPPPVPTAGAARPGLRPFPSLDDDLVAGSGASPAGAASPRGLQRHPSGDNHFLTVEAEPLHGCETTDDPAAGSIAGPGSDPQALRRVFDDFVALKKKCGESTSSLTFAKFSAKVEQNRQMLIAKHGCSAVKFQVYVKDGRAALRATPIKAGS